MPSFPVPPPPSHVRIEFELLTGACEIARQQIIKRDRELIARNETTAADRGRRARERSPKLVPRENAMLEHRSFDERRDDLAARVETIIVRREKCRCGRFVDRFPRSCAALRDAAEIDRICRCRLSFPSPRDRRTLPA